MKDKKPPVPGSDDDRAAREKCDNESEAADLKAGILAEREACAQIAFACGCEDVGEAIRARPAP